MAVTRLRASRLAGGLAKGSSTRTTKRPFPAAVISGGSQSTLTNPDSDGTNYNLCTFSTSATLTVAVAGWVYALVVGRGASGYAGNQGTGGRVWGPGWLWLDAGTYSVTVPTGGTDVDGAGASIGSAAVVGAVSKSPSNGTGAGGDPAGTATGIFSTITGSSVEYARRIATSANPGDASSNAGTVVAGAVYVRAEL